MDAKFATCFFLREWKVYGYRLKPFCLHHSARLEAIESPLVCGGDIHPIDIVRAAQICSNYSSRYEKFHSKLIRRIIQNADRQLAIFQAYMEESCSRPDLQEKMDSAGEGISPWKSPSPLVVVDYLIRNTTITEPRAWTMPEGLAMWHFYSVREQECGRSEIFTEEDRVFEAELKAKNEAMQPIYDRQSRNLALRRWGFWPEGMEFDINAELPEEAYEKLKEVSNG